MIYKTEGVASRGRAVTKFTALQEIHSPTQHFVKGQHECFFQWAKAYRTVTGCDMCQTQADVTTFQSVFTPQSFSMFLGEDWLCCTVEMKVQYYTQPLGHFHP